MPANRLRHAAAAVKLQLPAPLPETKEPALEAAVYRQDGSAPIALFTPLHYERNYAYPLLIWLHGDGHDETQLRRLMPLVSMRNYAAAAPRGTEFFAGLDGGENFGWVQDPEQITEAEARVMQTLEVAESKLRIHPGRIFLAGSGSGGTMALRLVLREPRRFAGAISLGGPLPTGGTPLARLNEMRRVPVLLAAGSASSCYPAEQVCQDLRLLHAAGISVTLRHYSCSEEIVLPMLADMNRWIMAQVTGCEPADAGPEASAQGK